MVQDVGHFFHPYICSMGVLQFGVDTGNNLILVRFKNCLLVVLLHFKIEGVYGSFGLYFKVGVGSKTRKQKKNQSEKVKTEPN